MLKLLSFLFFCMIHLACVNIAQEVRSGDKKVNGNARATILWTIDWSPDDRFYAIGGDDRLLKIYETNTHKLFKTYALPGAIQCLDWNKDSKILAIALDGHPAQLLNVETGKITKVPDVSGSRAVAWNANGQLLAVGDYDGNLRILRKEGTLIKLIKKENTRTYLSVDWHPEKNIILTGSDKIRLIDTSGNILQNIKHRAEETIILTVKWHPGGNFYAIGDYGHKEEGIESLLQFWNEDGTLIKSISGSKAEYRNVRWNKSGSLLASASDALRLWSKQGQLVYTGKSAELLWGIDWNRESRNIITTSEKGSIQLWTNEARLVNDIL